MSLTADIINYILADAGVTDLIDQRLYDMFVPEETPYPYCIFVREGMLIEDHLTGTTPLRQSDYQLTIASERSVDGEEIEEAMITILASMRNSALGSSNVRVIYYQGSNDSFLTPVDGSEESVHLITMKLEVHWKKT